jgi:histidinol phosphatase-like PHP family hydrolase
MPGCYPRHDLQVHTKWSDGYRSAAGQVYLAAALSLEALAITDHLFPGLPLDDPEQRRKYRAEIADAAGKYSRGSASFPTVYAGVEATAVDSQGDRTISEEVAREFEWVLCDLSYLSKGTLAETPKKKTSYERNVFGTYHAMCSASYIDVISHPFNTGNTKPALFPGHYSKSGLQELAAHMAETGTVFDVMNSMPLWFLDSDADPEKVTREYTELTAVFARAGVLFQMSSDDHRSGLGNIAWSRKVLAAADVNPRLVVRPGLRLPK